MSRRTGRAAGWGRQRTRFDPCASERGVAASAATSSVARPARRKVGDPRGVGPAFVVTVAALLLAGLPGCGALKSSAPPAAYSREGAAIGLTRERSTLAERQREAAQATPAWAPAAPPAADASAAGQAPAAAAGTVKHVVIAWLKRPGDPADRRKVIDSAAALRTIPGVVAVEAGECLPSDRAVVDSSYDVAIVTTFASRQALHEYGPHPTHQQVVEDVIKPNVQRYVVYDFVLE